MSGFGSTRLGWFLGIAIAFWANSAVAQIAPDGTLPNNSIVTQEGNTSTITGGTKAGGNLFHSFREFSVPTNGTAYFNNAFDIQNIISRVTGKSISEINGLIKANGTANLFLINQNGIIFRQNARLDIGGSFVATTASAIAFGNQGFFSATNPSTPEVLTVNPSAFFFNQIAAPIQNNSVAPAGLAPSRLDSFGLLRVKDGQSLLLVGGNINMDSGQLNAFGGRVELGGLAEPGKINILVDGNNLSLGFPAESTLADISLTNRASVRVDAATGGSIVVNARNLDISGGSTLQAGIGEGLGSVGNQAGDITLNATGEIKVVGVESGVFNEVRSQAVGNGGNININAASFSLTDNAQLQTRVRAFNDQPAGRGNAGNITINVTNDVTIAGAKDGSNRTTISSGVAAGRVGNGGNINIKAASFSVKDGAQMQTGVGDKSDTQPAARGNGGNITINVTGDVKIVGVKIVGVDEFRSVIGTFTGGTGNGGNITISSGSLSITDGGLLIANTNGEGNAGNVTVNVIGNVKIARVVTTPKNIFRSAIRSGVDNQATGNGGNITISSGSFSLTDGALLDASISKQGNAGDVSVQALGSVELAGSDTIISSNVEARGVGNGGNININAASVSLKDGAQLLTSVRGASNDQPAGRGKAGNITIKGDAVVFDGVGSNDVPSGASSAVETGAEGNGGSLSIFAGRFNVLNGAEGTVSNQGISNLENGNAGELKVIANSIKLDNKGKLTADSANGKGGNITLRARDLLLLRRNSSIFARNTSGNAGRDGNININTKFLVASPSENSDITATGSERSVGSNIQVNASGGIFGIEYQPKRTPKSDIVATGSVTLNTLDIDPSRGLVELPTNLVDASQQLDKSCSPGSKQQASSFVITGRGGLPPNPKDILTPDAIQVDWVTLNPDIEKNSRTNISTNPTNPTPEPIVEATGWMFNAKGEVVFTADAPTTPHSSWNKPTGCHT